MIRFFTIIAAGPSASRLFRAPRPRAEGTAAGAGGIALPLARTAVSGVFSGVYSDRILPGGYIPSDRAVASGRRPFTLGRP